LLCVFLVAGFVCFAEGVPDCTHSSGAVSTSIVENFEALYYSKLQDQVQPSLPASYTYSVWPCKQRQTCALWHIFLWCLCCSDMCSQRANLDVRNLRWEKKIKRVIETEYLPSLSWKYLQGLQIARALAKNGHVQCPMYIQWLVNVQTPSIPTQIHQFETGPSFPHTHSHAHTDTDTDTEAHTYTCKHTHANTHTHTHIHTHTRTRACAHTHTHTQTHTNTHTHIHKHTHTQPHTHSLPHAHKIKHTHTRTHTITHKHKHWHRHTSTHTHIRTHTHHWV